MAGSASCYPVGHLHNSQFRCRWWRSSSTVGNQWQRRRALQAWSDTAKSSCKAPCLFLLLIDVFNVICKYIQSHRALSQSTLLFFIPLCPRFGSLCPSAVAQFAAHTSCNSAFLAWSTWACATSPAGASPSSWPSHEAFYFHFLHWQLSSSCFVCFLKLLTTGVPT